MAQVITIRKGDADTLTETIVGLVSLSGYTAKMYITTSAGVALATLTGVIDGLTITYQLVNEATKLYAVGDYNFETKIYDASDHVYTPSYGKFIVLSTVEEDPA